MFLVLPPNALGVAGDMALPAAREMSSFKPPGAPPPKPEKPPEAGARAAPPRAGARRLAAAGAAARAGAGASLTLPVFGGGLYAPAKPTASGSGSGCWRGLLLTSPRSIFGMFLVKFSRPPASASGSEPMLLAGSSAFEPGTVCLSSGHHKQFLYQEHPFEIKLRWGLLVHVQSFALPAFAFAS